MERIEGLVMIEDYCRRCKSFVLGYFLIGSAHQMSSLNANVLSIAVVQACLVMIFPKDFIPVCTGRLWPSCLNYVSVSSMLCSRKTGLGGIL